MTFSEEAFLAQKPGAPLQAFHRRAVHLQLFKQVRRWLRGQEQATGSLGMGLEGQGERVTPALGQGWGRLLSPIAKLETRLLGSWRWGTEPLPRDPPLQCPQVREAALSSGFQRLGGAELLGY